MSLATDVAVAAAERVERTGGPGPGLSLWRRLASNAGTAELRGRAVLGGLRCAIAVRDLGAIRDLSFLWATVEVVSEPVWDGLFSTCKDLARAKLTVAAVALAHAEVRRGATARALYAYARCLDVAGDARAAAAFRDAIERGEKEGAPALVRASRVRRAAWLGRSADTLSDAIDEAQRVVASEVTPAERLELARVLLRAPSRFARAGALAMLDDLVSSASAGEGASAGEARERAWRAMALAARHADDRGDELTPLEVDRLLALFSRESIAKEVVRVRDTIRVIDRLARAHEKKSHADFEAALDDAARVDPALAVLHRRAREILQGRFEAWGSTPAPSTGATGAMGATGATGASGALAPSLAWTALLDAVVAIRDSGWPRASEALRRLAELAEAGERVPPHVWTVAMAALETDDATVRAVAGRLVAAMIKSATAAPPRGWLALARALAACGMDDLATTARRAATLAKEAGAAEALGLSLTRSGWQLALAGERSPAIARLREARSLAASQGRSPSPSPSPGAQPAAGAPGDGGTTAPTAAPSPRPDPEPSPST